MAVAATVLAPLTENCGAGASAMASLNVAVSVSVVPALTGLVAEYARAAVGAVLSTSTWLVSSAVKVINPLLPDASLIVAPFKVIAGATAMPSASVSPLTTV